MLDFYPLLIESRPMLDENTGSILINQTMKNTAKKIAGVSICLAVIQPAAHAEEFEHNLTFALRASFTDPALRARDENGAFVNPPQLSYSNEWQTQRGDVFSENFEAGTKITVARFSNREILEELIVGGGHDSTIRGWALKLITPEDADEAGDEISMFAVKGDEYVPIDFVIELGGEAEQERYTYQYTYNEKTDRETVRESGTSRLIAEAMCGISFNDIDVSFSAILNASDTLRTIGRGEDATTVWFPTAIVLASIVGSGSDGADEEDESPAVVDGSIRAAGARYIQ